MKCSLFGDRAVLVDLDVADRPDRAVRTRALAESLRKTLGPTADVVLGAGSVLVAGLGREGVSVVEAAVRAAPDPADGDPARGRLHAVPVVYDGADLEEVARIAGLEAPDVVALHAGRDHVVELLGFLPGFAYLGPVDGRLVVPRRPSPRPRVDAGCVALAGGFTGIYPLSSPGGWHLIGRTTFATFDPDRDPPAILCPGDRVRFVPCAPDELPVAGRRARAEEEGSRAAMMVEHASPGCSIQDAGRPGRVGDGVPPSGPLDPDTHAAANLAVGNDAGEAAVEVPLGRMRFRALREVLISIDGDAPLTVGSDALVEIAPGPRAVRYLAVGGGVDVPLVLGARATLVVARIGGISGRHLRAGDRIAVGARRARANRPHSSIHAEAAVDAIEIDPGPHVDRFAPDALERFAAGAWMVSPRSDRVGTRLAGITIARDGPDLALPVPMVRGAIQVTTDGTPIVLGPDHPVTGGYPVLAVVRSSSLGALARLRPGAIVSFRLETRE